jgi:hypothetical protein
VSNSKYVVYTNISPNSSARTAPISKITIHHMAGNCSIEVCGNIFADASRQGSSNYGIGTDGRIGLYVDESRRAWTSSNRENDNVAVTIEVANDGGAPDWHISDKALESLIKLCVDICKRNGIKALNYTGDASGNLTRHNMFAATGCPGAYLQSKFPYIAQEVNKQLNAEQPKEIYRVRKSWADVKSQIGAFYNIEYAKNQADSNKGYFVFDSKGNAIYPAAAEPLKVGDRVRLKPNAVFYDGKSIAGFVFDEVLYVRSISGNRVVVSIFSSGAVTGAVDIKYLERVS